MRPGSFLGILLELLEELDRPGPLPADARVGKFFRARRYLGARDRRFLASAAYGWLRHRTRGRARWDAWAARSGAPPAGELTGREAPLSELAALASDGLLPWSREELLSAAREVLPPPPSFWGDLMSRAGEPGAFGPDDWPAEPPGRLAAELSLPPWLAARLASERGEEAARLLGAALLGEAPVDLRVNASRVSREQAAAELEELVGRGGVTPTPLSQLGLRLAGRTNLGAFQTAHPGWIEVQDEGSQLLVLSAEPGSSETVIDACAGAGGKTLAVLDLQRAAGRAGRVHACEVVPDKLEELRRRAQLLGEAPVVVHPITPDGPLPAALPVEADLVLVDAPCSGTGTLRRSPELKHRYGPEDVARFAGVQLSILRRFATRVRPGGRLVYTTCSLLAEENDEVVDAFLRETPGFQEARSAWADAHLPAAARAGARLRLDPVATCTDGFFLAALKRVE